MQAAFMVIARLVPALAGGPALVRLEEPLVTVVAPLIGPPIDWRALAEWTPRAVADTARTRRRTKAVEYSGFYHFRLTLHRWLSFAMVPLFVGSYVTGDQVLKHSSDAPAWALNWHRPLATATAVLFTANTVTGLWNLWDSRKDSAGRLKRYVHSLLFIAADAGFTWAGTTLAKEGKNSEQKRLLHRNVALASMGVSITSWSMMLFFK